MMSKMDGVLPGQVSCESKYEFLDFIGVNVIRHVDFHQAMILTDRIRILS